MVIVNTYLIQGIISVLITIVLANYFLDLPAHAGLLLPMAFGQGPGQAANIGGVFESYAANPFNGGRTFGLAIATFGFIWSSVGGIFYLNRRANEGKIKRIEANTAANITSEVIEAEDEIPVNEAIDKMSIQIIFIIIIYFFAYLFMKGITELVNIDAVTGLVWGFNFIFAMLFAIVAKQILNLLRKSGLMKRKYTNNYMLNRIAGVVFDFMIVASIMSIDLSLLFNSNLWIALIIISTIGGFLSYFYLKFIVKRIYPDYEHEAFATLYGTLTGTASNGISLLREIDPSFKTPAADDLVGGSSSAVMFGAPILAITAIIYLPEWYYLWGSLLALVLFFALFSFFLFKQKVPTKE